MRASGASDSSTTTLARRTLDPAERYFWLLDRLACSTIGAIAELDRVLDHRELEAAAAALQSRHPLLRTRIEVADGQLFLVEASGPVPLSAYEADAASLIVDVAALLDQPFLDNGGPMVRLISLRLGPERSAVILSAHHALMDGRGAVTVLQQLLRWAEFGAGRARPHRPPRPLRACMTVSHRNGGGRAPSATSSPTCAPSEPGCRPRTATRFMPGMSRSAARVSTRSVSIRWTSSSRQHDAPGRPCTGSWRPPPWSQPRRSQATAASLSLSSPRRLISAVRWCLLLRRTG